MAEISEENALTALCVWEELLSILGSADKDNAYVRKVEAVGVCEMRRLALHVLAPAVETAYNAVSEEFDDPFDWEFVPSFLALSEPILAKGLFSIPENTAEEIGRKIAAAKKEGVFNER